MRALKKLAGENPTAGKSLEKFLMLDDRRKRIDV